MGFFFVLFFCFFYFFSFVARGGGGGSNISERSRFHQIVVHTLTTWQDRLNQTIQTYHQGLYCLLLIRQF